MAGVNENKPPNERRVEFGKHAGKTYGDLPLHYLYWLRDHAFKGQSKKQRRPAARVRWAIEEINRRQRV